MSTQPLLTLPRAAEALGVKAGLLRNYIDAGSVPSVRVGRRAFLRVEICEALKAGLDPWPAAEKIREDAARELGVKPIAATA